MPLVPFSQTTRQVALRRHNDVIVTLHFSPAHHVPFWFWLGGVETAPKQHIFITCFFSEVQTSPKYYVTVMLWLSELKTTPKYDVNATL